MAHRMWRVGEVALQGESYMWGGLCKKSRRIWTNGSSKFEENQNVLKRMEWRWMPLDWMNGSSDNHGGRKCP